MKETSKYICRNHLSIFSLLIHRPKCNSVADLMPLNSRRKYLTDLNIIELLSILKDFRIKNFAPNSIRFNRNCSKFETCTVFYYFHYLRIIQYILYNITIINI